MSNTADAIERFVAKQQAKLRAAEQLQEIAREFPELIEELFGKQPHAPVNGEASGRGRSGKGTAFARIVRLFLQNDNSWLDTAAITDMSGVHRNVAATVLWSVKKDDFEQRPHETHARMKVWRLKPERFDQLRKQRRLFDNDSAAKTEEVAE